MLPFIHPFTAIVAGPTCCGKTRFVFRLIDNASLLISLPPTKTVYFYGEYQQLFNQYPHIEFHQGLPNIEDFDGREPTLVIIDDLMQDLDLESNRQTPRRDITPMRPTTRLPTCLRKVRTTETSASSSSPKTFSRKTNLLERSVSMPTTWFCSRIRETSVSLQISRDRCIRSRPSLPSKRIKTRSANRTVIC